MCLGNRVAPEEEDLAILTRVEEGKNFLRKEEINRNIFMDF